MTLLMRKNQVIITEEGNMQLGGQAVPTEKEKLTSSLGAQNKQRKVTIRTER